MRYIIIGGGRMASHWAHYLNLQNIPFIQLTRKTHSPLEFDDYCKQKNSCFLLLINDDEIIKFYENHPSLKEQRVFHFSGALVCHGIQGLHPLMTFSERFYDLEFYKKIPFVVEKGAYHFHEIFPFLSNPVFEIDTENKVFYHALCVLGGNCSTILWQKVIEEFEKKLKLPREILFPYMKKGIENLCASAETSLTGPFVRKDQQVINKHLDILKNDQFLDIYKSFAKIFFKELEE